MVGININKKQTSNLLKCSAYKKVENATMQNLLHETNKLGIFFGKIVSSIKSEEGSLGSAFLKQQDTLVLETADSVEEILQGDLIYIDSLDTAFIVADKEYVFYNNNGMYLKYNKMNKITRFNLRGNI